MPQYYCYALVNVKTILHSAIIVKILTNKWDGTDRKKGREGRTFPKRGDKRKEGICPLSLCSKLILA